MILGMADSPMGKVVDAEVPLAEMFGYATDLRSATQGRATFTMEFESMPKRQRMSPKRLWLKIWASFFAKLNCGPLVINVRRSIKNPASLH